MQGASDIALTSRRINAQEALQLHLVQGISKTPESTLAETIEKAKQIAAISPDGIIVTRAALREAWETASVDRAFPNHSREFLREADERRELCRRIGSI